MTPGKQQTPLQPVAARQRPLHTRKSAWKIGWPDPRPRRQDPSRLEPATL